MDAKPNPSYSLFQRVTNRQVAQLSAKSVWLRIQENLKDNITKNMRISVFAHLVCVCFNVLHVCVFSPFVCTMVYKV